MAAGSSSWLAKVIVPSVKGETCRPDVPSGRVVITKLSVGDELAQKIDALAGPGVFFGDRLLESRFRPRPQFEYDIYVNPALAAKSAVSTTMKLFRPRKDLSVTTNPN